jgi:hypothetical protein
VIGNGFDLWHGIPSNFSDFKRYVRVQEPQIFSEIEKYLPVDDEWSQLEQALAEIDVDALVEDLGHFMPSYGADDWSDSGHHDFQYEVGKCVGRLSGGLKAQLSNWVKGLVIPSGDNLQRRLATLDPAAKYLSFNYTSTLSSVYGIDPQRVCFIHGSVMTGDEELILGHAWDPSARQSLCDRADSEEMDVRLFEANHLIDRYFSSTFKRSDEIIGNNTEFFDNLSDVNQVVILGHSLSKVDAAYFAELLKNPALGLADWTVACRSLSEVPKKKSILSSLGVPVSKIEAVGWEDV